MSLKLKALGLALVAALAMSAVAVLSASAETGGHFESEVEHTTLVGTQWGSHQTEFFSAKLGEHIFCEEITYHGTTTTKTVTEVTIIPTYNKCRTTESVRTVNVTGFGSGANDCDLVFTIRKTEPEKKDNTIHLVCHGTGKVVVDVTEGGSTVCKNEFKSQTPAGGVTYTTGGTGKTHELTLDVTVNGLVHEFHGLCLLTGIGTGPHADGVVAGSMVLKGIDTDGKQVGITATGF